MKPRQKRHQLGDEFERLGDVHIQQVIQKGLRLHPEMERQGTSLESDLGFVCLGGECLQFESILSFQQRGLQELENGDVEITEEVILRVWGEGTGG